MSVLDFFKRNDLNLNSRFHITQRGTESLANNSEDYETARYRILVVLESAGGSMNVESIAQRAHLAQKQVERVLPSLMHQGFIETLTNNQNE